jgi:anti-sigma factor RsiW
MNLQTSTIEKNCPRSEIAAYIDGELSPRAELALEMHVAGCRDCLDELNLQKQLICALDYGLEKQPEIELPKNFAKVVAVRAESGVCGLRSKEERFRALFICSFLLLFVLLGLGAETGRIFAAFGKIGEQAVIIAGFAGHLVYDLAVGVTIILRSLSGQFVFNSLISIALTILLFTVSALLLTRLISRYNRS